MSKTILVVAPGPEFTSTLSAMLSLYSNELDIVTAQNRREALAALQKTSFQQIITSLKIPGVNDGYRFLSQVVNKVIDGKKVIVIVDQITKGIQAGISTIGLERVYTIDNFDEILQVVLSNIGLAPPAATRLDNLPASSLQIDKVRHALNQVMGPVGALIYQNALKLCKNQGDLVELTANIAAEIGEKEQVDLFYAQLR